MLPPFRFAVAYIRKTGLRRYTLDEEKSLQHHHGILLKHLNPLRASKSQNIYEKVFGASSEWTGRWILADYVHYSDIINLSLVSRYVHIKIQSSGGSSREAFRMRTCIPGSKASCWGCGNQICSVRLPSFISVTLANLLSPGLQNYPYYLRSPIHFTYYPVRYRVFRLLLLLCLPLVNPLSQDERRNLFTSFSVKEGTSRQRFMLFLQYRAPEIGRCSGT